MPRFAANPRPNLTPIPTDPKELYSRAYRRVNVSTDIYDAPNGKPIGHLDPGFNFVNAGSVQNGWVQIRAGQWLPDSTLGPIKQSRLDVQRTRTAEWLAKAAVRVGTAGYPAKRNARRAAAQGAGLHQALYAGQPVRLDSRGRLGHGI